MVGGPNRDFVLKQADSKGSERSPRREKENESGNEKMTSQHRKEVTDCSLLSQARQRRNNTSVLCTTKSPRPCSARLPCRIPDRSCCLPDGDFIRSKVSFQNVLLNHPMGVEERAVESHGMQHDIDETVALVVKHGNDHLLQLVVER